MLIQKAYKVRLSPSSQQAMQLAQGAGCARLVWNRALAMQQDRLAAGQRILSFPKLCEELTGWKKDDDLSFLRKAPSQPLQQVLDDLSEALSDGLSKAKGMPKFKKKSRGNDAMRFPQGIRLEGRKIYLPKIGLVKRYEGRPVVGAVKNVTVRLEAGLWYAAIQVEQELGNEPVHPRTESIVGIDVGVKRFATFSNGMVIEPVSIYRKQERKLAILQRSYARKKKGSQNRGKQRLELQRLHEKTRRIRHDFLHKASHWVAKNHGFVVLEDLQIQNMTKSARGTKEQPGKNVKQKAGLNKSILDQGWGEFKRQLRYKLDWSGGTLVVVPAHYTSQCCSSCGHTAEGNRRSQAEFVCEVCNFSCNADENAARNIQEKALGHRVLACGSNPARGRKQEPEKKRKGHRANKRVSPTDQALV